jgi:tRNA U34 5-methylaminomethyl-2-thiouridine-forming methyltransferase MnmC
VASLCIILTSDGSHTIKNETTGDTFHSIHGAVQESNHVFIERGLRYFLGLTASKKIKILEVGFGTGLNALLSMKENVEGNFQIEYTALEPFPLQDILIKELNYSATHSNFNLLHEAEWTKPFKVSPHFELTKIKNTIQSVELAEGAFDVVYYDAFAPNSQPDMWSLEVFKKIKSLMARPSLLVTYCAKGQVKRDLKSAGFMVEGIPGPPGKREMVRAKVGC